MEKINTETSQVIVNVQCDLTDEEIDETLAHLPWLVEASEMVVLGRTAAGHITAQKFRQVPAQPPASAGEQEPA